MRCSRPHFLIGDSVGASAKQSSLFEQQEAGREGEVSADGVNGPAYPSGIASPGDATVPLERWSRVVDQGLVKRRPPPGEPCSSCVA